MLERANVGFLTANLAYESGDRTLYKNYMSFQKTVIGHCATPRPENLEEVSVNLSRLIQRLLLFDKYILESIRLKEFPFLVKAFGYNGVMTLLKSKSINIYFESVTVGQFGQVNVLEKRQRYGLLPLGSYCFELVRTADYRSYVHQVMQEIHKIDGLNHKEVIRLKSAIASKLLESSNTTGLETLAQLKVDLRANIPSIAVATAFALKEKLKTEINLSDFSICVHFIDEDDFRVETNISQKFRLNEQETHDVVERALLSVSGLNRRIETMKTYSALSGFQQGELPVLDAKLNFLAHQISPEAQEERFGRVVKITGFPDLSEAILKQQVSISKVLQIRDTSECREFREWLYSTDSLTDKEITDRFGSLKEKLLLLANGNAGKTVRWLANTTCVLLPDGGVFTGPAAGLLDAFLIEKILPKPGPISFLSKLYPSIFKDR